MRKMETEDFIVTFDDSDKTKEEVFEAVVKFFKDNESFNGESVMQCDEPIINAPYAFADIADSIIKFKVEYKED